jgi:hypothetical protein
VIGFWSRANAHAILRLLAGVGVRFGMNSNEYEMAGAHVPASASDQSERKLQHGLEVQFKKSAFLERETAFLFLFIACLLTGLWQFWNWLVFSNVNCRHQ